MAKNLMSDIKLTLEKCDNVLTLIQKVRNSLEPESFIQLTNYKGRFYLKEIDKRTVSIRCVPGNALGSYYRFVLTREDGSCHIKITLRDFHGDDAFGAMGEDYFRKPLEKLAECVEDNTAKDYLPMSLLKSIDTIKHRLGRFLPMPFFDKPGVKAFVFSGHSLVIYAASLEDKLILSVITPDQELIDLYAVKRNDNSLLEIDRLNYKETLLPDKVVLAVNEFVTKLNSHQPHELC